MEGSGPLDIDLSKPVSKVGRDRDGRICVCGHGARAHGAIGRDYIGVPIDSVPRGAQSCVAGRQECACIEFDPVLETSDVRRFMSKTVGPDRDHALFRGVQNALTAGASIHWKPNLVCGKCKAPNERLHPVAVKFREEGAYAARAGTEYNYLLCQSCMDALPLEPDPKNFTATEPKVMSFG